MWVDKPLPGSRVPGNKLGSCISGWESLPAHTWKLWEKYVGFYPDLLLIWRFNERFGSNDSTGQNIKFLTKVMEILILEGLRRNIGGRGEERNTQQKRRIKTRAMSGLLPAPILGLGRR